MKYKNLSITPVFVEEPKGGYSAYIKEIPGINIQGETKEEVKQNLVDALEMIFASKNDLNQVENVEYDWWNTLSSSEVEAIQQGLKDFENGNVHSHDEALEIYGKYL